MKKAALAVLFAAFFAPLLRADHALSARLAQQFIAQDKITEICTPPFLHFARAKMEENLLSAYADACARRDFINRLLVPISLLRNTPEGRQNAVIFSTLIYKKKLLQSALIDGFELSGINLPKVPYFLSEVYDAFASGELSAREASEAEQTPAQRVISSVYEGSVQGKEIKLFAAQAPQKKRFLVILQIKNGDKIETKEYF